MGMGRELDTGNPSKRDPVARKESRTTFVAEVSFRRPGSHHFRANIRDVSPSGCRIEFVERPALDERVWVKFDGLEAIEGAICWIEGPLAGVEFTRPIYPAVFERLVGPGG